MKKNCAELHHCNDVAVAGDFESLLFVLFVCKCGRDVGVALHNGDVISVEASVSEDGGDFLNLPLRGGRLQRGGVSTTNDEADRRNEPGRRR